LGVVAEEDITSAEGVGVGEAVVSAVNTTETVGGLYEQ